MTSAPFLSSPRALFLLLVLTAIVLVPMLRIGFVNDDLGTITFAFRNGHPVPSLLLTRQGVTDVYYRPLVDLTFAIDYWIWGWNALGFRLTNLLLHLVNVALTYLLARRLFASPIVALAGAALFGVLPIHETSLLWIPGRTDMLCCCFYLASLLLFIRWTDSRRVYYLAFSLLAFLLALLSKEAAFSLPLLLPVVVWWLSYRTKGTMRAMNVASMILPYLSVAVVVVIIRWILLDNNLLGSQGLHGGVGPATIVKNIATYIGLLVIPFGHYRIEGLLSAHPGIFMALAVASLLIISVVLWRMRQQLQPLLFCTLWIIVTVLPMSRLMMRWYLYIPSVGFCMALGWLLDRAVHWRTSMGVALVSGVWLMYVSIAVGQSIDWTAASRVYERMIADVKQQATITAATDTLTFVTLPAKIGTTPILHLGLPTTLHHYLGSDSLGEHTWAKVIMDDDRADVSYRIEGENDLRLKVAGGYFFLADEDFVAKRKQAEERMTVAIDGADITIVALDERNKPSELLIHPHRPLGLNTFFFDGDRFVRLK